MYNSKPHQEHDLARLHQHMLDTRLAVLVSHGEQGLLATHLPVLVDTARASSARCMATWPGPTANGKTSSKAAKPAGIPGADAYVSPSFYPSKADNPKVVPTWNYLAVHAYGPADVIHEAEPLLASSAA
jgi:transcriptional regulator